MTRATTQEEILFLVRANERISAFQEQETGEDKFEDGGFITSKRHYEILDDYEPAPSFMKTLTNEILYLDSGEEDSVLDLQATTEELMSLPKNSTQDSYLHVQNINSGSEVPSLIKDSLRETRKESGKFVDLIDVSEHPSLSKSGALSSRQMTSGQTLQTQNSSSGYGKMESPRVSVQKNRSGNSQKDIDRRIQPNIHSRQVQPSNTSQKILSSRINTFAGYGWEFT